MGFVTSLFAHKVAAAAGIDAGPMLRDIGIDPDARPDPQVMLEDTTYYSFIEALADHTDITDLPLKTGASMLCDDYGALGLAWKAAPTVGASFARVARYARLWTSVVDYSMEPVSEGILYHLHRSGERRLGLRISNEATHASGVALARQCSTAPFSPKAVYFKHSAPKTTQHHEDYFQCPVYFDADADALLLDPASLEQPNKLGDAGITEFLLGHLDAELATVSDVPAIQSQTKDAIARALSDGDPKMADIARSLGMSARSYHRRLSDHGLSFQALTDDTRRELAEGLLRDESHSLAEVAFLTGFAEQSSFTRAFKRWVGATPASYRKGL